jgi:hypothetical protein
MLDSIHRPAVISDWLSRDLFGDLEGRNVHGWRCAGALIGQEISDDIGLPEIVTQTLGGFSVEELQAVFCSLIERVQN